MARKRELVICAAMVILAVGANNLYAEEVGRDRESQIPPAKPGA